MVKYSKCTECDDKQLKEALTYEKINVLINSSIPFCSVDCIEAFRTRNKDEIIELIKKLDITEQIDDEVSELKNRLLQLKEDLQTEKEKGYTEGFFEGMETMTKLTFTCPYCREKTVEGIHHILPRSYGGCEPIADYHKAYNILMDYWDSLPEEERPKIDKRLKEVGV